MYWDKKEHPKFEASIKALIYNKEGKLFFAKDNSGRWDLPGGRIEVDETVAQCLEREIKEELGVKVKAIDSRPTVAELITYDDLAKRFIIAFKVDVESFDFVPSGENIENTFVSKEEFDQLQQAYKGLKTIKDKIFIN